MTYKKTVSIRLQDELLERIDTQAKESGRSRTALVVEILRQALDLPQPASASISPIALQQQLTRLEEQVKTLSEKLAALKKKGEKTEKASASGNKIVSMEMNKLVS